MFQKCPICNGTGKSGSFITCDVCNGKKIISELNGKPPINNGNEFEPVMTPNEYQKLIKINDDITIKNAELNKAVELLIESNVNTEEEVNKLKVFFEIQSSLGGNGNQFESNQIHKLREKIDCIFKEPTRIINSDSNLHLCVYDAANEEFSCHGISIEQLKEKIDKNINFVLIKLD